MTEIAKCKDSKSGASGVSASWPLTIVLALIGFALQMRGELNCDDSWFITFAERVLGGATAYVDISDPNTPAAFLIYMPAVALAKISGLRAEALVVIEASLVLAANLALAFVILNNATQIAPSEAGKLRNAAIFAFFILPGAMFAEREHFAAMFVLPILAAFYVRAEGKQVGRWLAIGAGIAAGCVLAIKPHFSFVLALPAFAMLLHQRSLAPICKPETFAAIGTFIAYIGVSALYFPAYFTVAMPDILEVYAPGRNTALDIIDKPVTLFLAFIYTAFVIIRHQLGKDGRADMLVLASGGFFIAYIVQGKMSPNHGMPAIAIAIMALLTLMIAKTGSNPARGERLNLWLATPTIAIAPLFTFVHVDLLQIEPYPGLKAAIAQVAHDRPKIAAITEIIDIPYPVVRQVGGTWIGHQNSLWRVNTTDFLIATTQPDDQRKRRYRAIADRDRSELAADIATGKPDIILVENSRVRERQLENPALAHVLDCYRQVAEASGVEIWARSTSPAVHQATQNQQ